MLLCSCHPTAAQQQQQLTYLVFPDEADFAIGAPATAAGPSGCSSRTWCFRTKPAPRSVRRRRLLARVHLTHLVLPDEADFVIGAPAPAAPPC
ncbi:hypothetical protein [Paenibacillus whitsoniae]|uniref:hypothetical protein n=1 Tax=Paenibacillus whitsoniae TaxID=2496558 RepID=UPI0013DF9762|nr:hypothetical protein [Paenibacillus whitsoniae]